MSTKQKENLLQMQQRYVLQNQADGRMNGSDHIRKILRSFHIGVRPN